MADLEKTIKIIFYGDDQVGKTITGISGNLDSLGSKAASATQPLADLAESAVKLEAALAALVVGGLVLAYKAASDFEGASIELQKVLGDEIGMLTQAEAAAIKLSETYGESATSILGSTANFKQAGFDISDALTLTTDAMDLVIAGGLGAAQSSEILIAILKGFKAPATDARVALDILNEVSNNFATDVEQLGIGMAALSPVAKTMGFSMAETAGILTPVIEIFRSGNEAAVALKTGLLKLIDDSAPVEKALKSIGVAQYDANGALRSGKDILTDVSTAFQTLDENQKLYITQQLVGINQAARMVEVFNGLGKSAEVTATAMGSAGSAAKEVATRLASAEVSVNRFKQSFVNLGIEVGQEFIEASTGAIDGATEINKALSGLTDSGTFDPVFGEIRNFATKLGVDLKAIAAALPEAFELIEWDPLIESVKGLGNEVKDLFEAFFGDIDLTTPEGLSQVIQKIVDSGTALTNVVGGILDAWAPFVRALSEGVDAFNESDDAVQRAVGQFLGWAGVINTVANNIGILTGALNLIGGSLTVIAGTNIVSMVGGLKALASSVSLATLGLGQFVAILAAPVAAYMLTDYIFKSFPVLDEFRTKLADALLSYRGLNEAAISSMESQAKNTQALGDAAVAMVRLAEAAGQIPDETSTEILVKGTQAYQDEFDAILAAVEAVPDEKATTVSANVDTSSVEAAKNYITVQLDDGTDFTIVVKADQAGIDTTKAKIEELPSDKEIELRLKGDIDIELASIKAQAETVQTSMEWTAKVDIAEAQAAAETVIALSDNISEMFQNTGDTLVGLAGSLAGLSGLSRLQVFEFMEEESRNRAELLLLEKEMTTAQVALINARTEALKKGGGLITIQADNIEPELQLVLHRILELTQIEANEQGLEFLIGV